MFIHKILNKLELKHPKLNLSIIKFLLFSITWYLIFRRKICKPRKSVLYAGQAYYNAWYLSRALREIGWTADVLNWDEYPGAQIYYHGEDFKFQHLSSQDIYQDVVFYLKALLKYDVFHFSNKNGMQFGGYLTTWFKAHFSESYEIFLLKKLGKKIVYSNNGCLDGVSQTSFSKWGPDSVCDICIWKTNSIVCNDASNLEWGKFRNQIADYQCLYGGNRVDYNFSPKVHEVPEFYCLNADLWHPDINVPEEYHLTKKSEETVYVYHTIGNKTDRTNIKGVNIKSTHVYLPLIDKLNQEGLNVELISPQGIPNKNIRYYQVQADIFLDMLSYGWFGATAREAMMLAKPVICYIRPEWLESLRAELPDCAAELPIISATPDTVEDVLRGLIADPEKRLEIGRKSREFCLKWHSDKAGAKRFNEIYTKLLNGDPQLLYSQPSNLGTTLSDPSGAIN